MNCLRVSGTHGIVRAMADPETVDAYLSALPDDRRAALTKVRDTIRGNLPAGYAEGIQYGMIGYFVPHARYPAGYHAKPSEPLPFLGLASKKGHMALYLMAVYSDPELRAWLESAWKKAGKKLDMGGSCLRFRRLDDIALDVVAELVAKVPIDVLIQNYEAAQSGARGTTKKATPTVKAKAAHTTTTTKLDARSKRKLALDR